MFRDRVIYGREAACTLSLTNYITCLWPDLVSGAKHERRPACLIEENLSKHSDLVVQLLLMLLMPTTGDTDARSVM